MALYLPCVALIDLAGGEMVSVGIKTAHRPKFREIWVFYAAGKDAKCKNRDF